MECFVNFTKLRQGNVKQSSWAYVADTVLNVVREIIEIGDTYTYTDKYNIGNGG